MWKKISASPICLATLAGLGTVLAFPPIEITVAAFLCPFFLILAIERCRTRQQAFWAGFFTSLSIMMGGFYWVVYVIHVFGHLPWSVATLIYLLFCGFGALNFPIFSLALFEIHRRRAPLFRNAYWFVLGIPALFVVIEYLVPKLFPWYVGHAFYKTLWLNQLVELTGTSVLTFLVFSWGGAAYWIFFKKSKNAPRALLVPLILFFICVGFSAYRFFIPLPPGPTKRVALIQANIGSLEKLEARQGSHGKMHTTVERYRLLTEKVLEQGPKPDLILWPETAMPFSLHNDFGWALSVRRAVLGWNIPLITGGYAPANTPPFGDYNAAFLLEPINQELKTDIYRKNILLAFGEYFPGGELFPSLYGWFPQVSNFRRGKDQNVFVLKDGTRLGVTICYEAIVPSFFRKVANQGVNAIVNLTNDSWFGPTSEPYQHAALSVFRSIETRIPLARVTNTGISFTVDKMGRLSRMTPVYAQGVLTSDIELNPMPTPTVYLLLGEWFVGLCLIGVVLFLFDKARVPLPI